MSDLDTSAPSQRDNFADFTDYLRMRGMQTRIGRSIAGFTVVLGVLPTVMLLSPAGPHGLYGRVVAVSVTSCTAIMAGLWLWRWPSRGQSGAYAIAASVCIAMGVTASSSPLAGLATSNAFAAIGGYLAFFHSARLMAVNLGVVAVTLGVLGYKLASTTGDPILTGAMVSLVVIAVVSMPAACRALAWPLARDALSSTRDPLTALHNRPAFHRELSESMRMAQTGRPTRLAVIMVDLDKFKTLNDTHGHDVGDRALCDVADIIRDSCRPGAVAARFGGEEFVIGGTLSPDAAWHIAERLHRALHRSSWGITASIGITTTTLGGQQGDDPGVLLDRLIAAADNAMYQAKRSGGDQTSHQVLERGD